MFLQSRLSQFQRCALLKVVNKGPGVSLSLFISISIVFVAENDKQMSDVPLKLARINFGH